MKRIFVRFCRFTACFDGFPQFFVDILIRSLLHMPFTQSFTEILGKIYADYNQKSVCVNTNYG